MENDGIIRLAALQRKIDDDEANLQEEEEFERSLAGMEQIDHVLLMVAWKLSAGRDYRLTTRDPVLMARCRAIVHHMGATVSISETDMGEMLTCIPRRR